jgi:protein-tyrosine phosphatase
MKILMVCLGNICRSPLAEGILQHKLKNKGLDWKVDSAGTGNWHIGSPPHNRSIEVAHKHGIDIEAQEARQLKLRDLENFDLILAMDTKNFEDITALTDEIRLLKKVKLYSKFAYPEHDIDIPDPYFDNKFEYTYQLLDKYSDAIIEQLVSQHSV